MAISTEVKEIKRKETLIQSTNSKPFNPVVLAWLNLTTIKYSITV